MYILGKEWAVIRDIKRGDVAIPMSGYGHVPTLFCDVDGTIADSSHRTHHISGRKKDWRAFMERTLEDPPIVPVIDAVRHFRNHGWNVVIVTARSEWNREKTMGWLALHDVPYDRLYMRNKYIIDRESGRISRTRKGKLEPDARPDRIVKEEILHEALGDGFEPDLILDDRNCVVEMWRNLGFNVIQVAEGDF